MRFPRIALAAALVTASGLAAAADYHPQGYLGASYGQSRFENQDFDGSDDAYKIYLGGDAGIIGGEVGYVNFGQLGGDGPDADAWTLAVTAGLPVGPVRLYGKLGWAFPEVEHKNVAQEIDDDSTAFYGAGVSFPLNPHFALRGEYERFDVGDEDLDLASVGVEFRF